MDFFVRPTASQQLTSVPVMVRKAPVVKKELKAKKRRRHHRHRPLHHRRHHRAPSPPPPVPLPPPYTKSGTLSRANHRQLLLLYVGQGHCSRWLQTGKKMWRFWLPGTVPKLNHKGLPTSPSPDCPAAVLIHQAEGEVVWIPPDGCTQST